MFSNNNDEFILLGSFEISPDHKSMGAVFLNLGKIIPISQNLYVQQKWFWTLRGLISLDHYLKIQKSGRQNYKIPLLEKSPALLPKYPPIQTSYTETKIT